eukprot:PLAT415.1.p1 GENE.PLAT415.1~~PLAT415.1.p1  ORF type:complete len:288 (+),score=97.37 PLAT415.1:124-864(+)
MYRYTFGELLGTFMYTLLTAGSVVSSGALTQQLSMRSLSVGRVLCIGLASGTAYAAVVSTFSSFSGHMASKTKRNFLVGHANPAVTFALALLGQVSAPQAVMYFVAQFLGAALAAVVLSIIVPDAAQTSLGATLMGEGVTPAMAVVCETIMTFTLVLTIMVLHVQGQRGNKFVKSIAPMLVGGVLAAISWAALSVSGASMNPARSFGPALMAAVWSQHWVYWVGPFLGAGLAALTFIVHLKKDKGR